MTTWIDRSSYLQEIRVIFALCGAAFKGERSWLVSVAG